MVFRIVQVGCGARGRMWDQVIHRHDDMTVSAYVDVNPAVAEAMARPRSRPYYADLDRALDEVESEAVLLVTPPFSDQRERQFESILRHRRPVLAEKPLTLDLQSSVGMAARMEAAGLPLCISLQFRYLPVSREIRRFVKNGPYGHPGFGQFTYLRNRDGRAPHLNKYPLTMDHPMLLEQTIHHYDLIRFCYDSEPVWLQAQTWNPSWSMYAHDSNVTTHIELANGIQVQYLGTWTAGWNGWQFEWRTDFPGGIVTQRSLFGDLYTAGMTDELLMPVPLEPFTPFYDDTALLLRDFVDAVRAGRPVPCSGRDHLRSLAMAFAAIESAQTGRQVDMIEFCRRYHV